MKAIVFLFFYLSAFLSYGQRCGLTKKNLQENSSEIIKSLAVQQVESSSKDFCHRNMLLRFINTMPAPPPNCESMTIAQLEDVADKASKSKKIPFDSWTSSLVPTQNMVDKSLDLSLMYSGITEQPIPRAKAILLNPSRKPTAEQTRFAIENFNHINTKKVNAKDETIQDYGQKFMCASYSISKFSSCCKSFKMISETLSARQTDGGQILTAPIWKKVLETEQYQEGLRLAGLKVISRLEGKTQKDMNVFDDFLSSFKESGLNEQDAIDATFNALTVISSGGPNTAQRINTFYYYDRVLAESSQNTTAVSLSIIASAMSKLDYEKMKRGEPPYSYPENIKTDCLYQKPYHFWMSAGIARHLKKEGIDSETAIYTTFGAQKGYQMNRDATGSYNNPNSVFSKPPYDPSHQVIRMDLAFAAAGANFGARYGSDKNMKLNVDASLKNLIEKSNPAQSTFNIENSTLNFPIKLGQWESIFSPNAALEAFEK